jgi:type VI secretion system protein ImpK
MEKLFEKTVQSCTMNLDLSDPGPGKISLNTLCTDLFLIIFNITSDLDMGSEQDMRRILRHFIDRFDTNCKSAGIETKKMELAKYALVALIDEKVLALPSKWSGPWSSHPLQFDYSGDMVAGQRFFEHLEEIMRNAAHDSDVLEVYFLCLCLGFKGKYGTDKPAVDELIKTVARTVVKHRPPVTVPQPPVYRENRRRRAVPLVATWMIVAVSASIAILLWFGAVMTVSKQSMNIVPTKHTGNETNLPKGR